MRTNDELIMENLYTEGFIDRYNAKKAGKEAEKQAGVGFGIKARSKVAGMVGGELKRKDQDLMTKGAIAKSSAQANTLISNYMPKFKAQAEKLRNDLLKMNVDISMIEDIKARKILIALLGYSSTIE